MGDAGLFGSEEGLKLDLMSSGMVFADVLARLAASAHVAGGSTLSESVEDVVAAVGRSGLEFRLRRDEPAMDARREAFSWRSKWITLRSSFSLLVLRSSWVWRVRRMASIWA